MGKVPNMHIIPAQTITANGNSGALSNLCDRGTTPSTVVLLIDLPNAPTGTTPGLVIGLDNSPDGTRWFNVGVTASLTAAGQTRLVLKDVLADNVRITWAVTGTTPSFAGVVITALFQ